MREHLNLLVVNMIVITMGIITKGARIIIIHKKPFLGLPRIHMRKNMVRTPEPTKII